MEPDGTHDAIENLMREGLGLAIQVAAHRRNTHAQKLLQAQRDAHDERMSTTLETLTARQKLDAAHASTTLQKVQESEWWDQTPANEIVDTYREAWEQRDLPPREDGSDPTRIVNAMDQEMERRFGFSGRTATLTGLSSEQAEGRYAEVQGRLATLDPKNAGVAEAFTKMFGDLQMSSALSGAAIAHGVAADAAAGAAEGRAPGAKISRGGPEQAPQREEGR